MAFGSYVKLVEPQTKVASVIPFMAGTLYGAARLPTFDWINALLMIGSLLAIDMATTALNNYMDHQRAIKKHGYGYEVHNAMGSDRLKPKRVRLFIGGLILVAVVLGGLLSLRSGWVLLILGALSFAVGLLYSAGPLPISRTPLGELFSGGFMGYLIPIIAILAHNPAQLFVNVQISDGLMVIGVWWTEVATIVLFFTPLAGAIANIMLANNICDRDDDLENQRYTLPVLVGNRSALAVFGEIYAIGYGAIAVLIILGAVPFWYAAFGLTLIPVLKNLVAFAKEQKKPTTFPLSVQNFVVQGLALCLLLGIQLIISAP